MRSPIVFLLIGILFGALVGSYATIHHIDADVAQRFSAPPERDIVRDKIVDMSTSQADAHRQSGYESVNTIEDALALPSDFAEREALYVIAGRADADELQNLIYQAARVSDKTESTAMLSVLLHRLTELDPLSALAIARSPALAGDRVHESNVWRAWGRMDLEAALIAAQDGTSAQKNLAAQSLHASVRVFDEAETALIESTLGISPSRDAQGKRLYSLVDESPAKAVEYIESLPSVHEQQERFRWLAYYLNRTERDLGADYSGLIKSANNRRLFEQWRDSYRLESDPEAVLQEALAENAGLKAQNTAIRALRQLAQVDPHKALEYLDQFPDPGNRQSVRHVAATAMARSDPHAALAWARNNDTSGDESLLLGVITEIAQRDAQLALAETQSISSPDMRAHAHTAILAQVAKSDPAAAAEIFEMIDDPRVRGSSVQKLANAWAQVDIHAAIDWVLALPDNYQNDALRGIVRDLTQRDIDAAIRVLPRLPARETGDLKVHIARTMVQQRSLAQAQTFIEQFKGTEDYARMQVEVLSHLASSNPSLAVQMAESVQDTVARDQLVASIAGRQAAQDPQLALQWLGSISDSGARVTAVSQIASMWHSRDPYAASAWIDGLPAGKERDMAIVSTISGRRESPSEVMDRINSVTDADMRKRATLDYVQLLSRTDREEARRIFQGIDLSQAERDRYRRVLD
ncbi:MAG: hypothetical protein QNJ07_16535 [Woeseiaceae bacterium]|nr:hypothetical protein [Woeseiaceae bacterium]